MRSFIAIELSDQIRESLAQIQSHLKYSGADVKWVQKDNIHLTLKFLGEIDENKSQQIKAILDEIGKTTEPFDMGIKDIGAFPKIDYPRVVWVGLDKGAAESKILAQSLDDALSKIGFQKETRPFAAHLTLGRVRSPKNKEALKEKITQYAVRSTLYERANHVTLYKSTLTPTGSIYTKLHESKFVASL